MATSLSTSGPPSNTRFLGPIRADNPKGILIGSAVFAGSLMCQTEPLQFSAHVYCGQTAEWIKMPLGTEIELGPGDFVLDGDPSPPPKKGRSPQFSAHCRPTDYATQLVTIGRIYVRSTAMRPNNNKWLK